MENAIDRKESMSSVEGGDEQSVDDIKTPESVSGNLSLLPPRNEDRRSSNSSLDQDKQEISAEDRLKVIEQAEFYFSDENLKKDGFLLKHVKRNKEGYVNLKLLASFKKMKTICKDFHLIAEILKDSDKLELSENGLKIKRIEPLPKELFETVPVKSVVVSSIPDANPSMDYIAAAFGEDHKEKIASVRIVKQGKKYPHDLQSHFARHPELADQISAVVEFEDVTTVTQILKIDFENHPVYKGLVVSLLEMGPKQGRKKKKNPETGDTETASATSNASDYDSAASIDTPSNRIRKKKKDRVSHLAAANYDDSSSYASSSDGEQSSTFQSFRSCGKRFERMHGGSTNSSANNSPQSSPAPQRRPNQLKVNDKNSPTSPKSGAGRRTPDRSPLARNLDTSPLARTPDRSPLSIQTNMKLSPLVTSQSPMSSPDNSRRREKSSPNNNNKPSPSGQSDWMRRRMEAAMNNSTEKLNTSAEKLPGHKHLEILRQPRGPDGSNGFGSHPMAQKFITVHAC